MELSWMKKHRRLIGQMIRFANTYTNMYNKVTNLGAEIDISPIQIQTLEYVIENENSNMTDLAHKLGVARTTFSKNVKSLEEQGLVEKFQRRDNKKNIYLFATDYGKKIYRQYSEYVYENWYKNLFAIADSVSDDNLEKFGEILDYYSYTLIKAGKVEDKLSAYVPLERRERRE